MLKRTLEPDLDAARRHLKLLTGEDDPVMCWQVFCDYNKNRTDLARCWHGRLETARPTLIKAQRDGCGVFVSVNRTDGGRRLKEHMAAARALFLDLDGSPLPDPWPEEPDLVIHSSAVNGTDKYQVWWRIDPTDDFAKWEAVQKALADRYQGDPNVALWTQVGRLAGFWHQKDRANPHQVKIAHDPGNDFLPPSSLDAVAAGLGWDANILAAKARIDRESVLAVRGGSVEPEQLEVMLAEVEVADYRDPAEWWRMMCACHFVTGGAGVDEFIEWSTGDPKYASHGPQIEGRWVTLRAKQGAITGSPLWAALRKAGRADLIPATAIDPDEFDDDPPDVPGSLSSFEVAPASTERPKRPFRFTPYVCRDPKTIPSRAYLYEPAYVRQFTTGTSAAGAVGKTGLLTAEALVMASGKPLLGVKPRGRFRVVLWNGEDPMEELVRSVEGARKWFGLEPSDVEGWFSMDSGRDLPIEIAVQDRTGTRVVQPMVDRLIRALRDGGVDVLIVDPFVTTHSVQENDNTAIDKVAVQWNHIAEEANCAIHLAHHVVKVRAGKDAEAMDHRGAGASLNKLRYLRVLNRLFKDEAAKIGVEPNRARVHIRIDDGDKANLLPPSEAAVWFKLESVDLGNADFERDGLEHAKSDLVRVATPWAYPDIGSLVPSTEQINEIFAAMGDEPWRKTSSSADRWVGIPIARVLGLDLSDGAAKTRVGKLVEAWATSGVLGTATPEKGDRSGNKREGYVPGKLPACGDDETE